MLAFALLACAVGALIGGADAVVTADTQISFAGRSWWVKDSKGARWDPGPCVFSPASDAIWVDENGM